MALEHLLNTSERDRCVQLVTQLVLPTYSAGQMSTVRRWLAALGDTTITSHPPLMVLAGWVDVLGGEPLEAERWAALADDAVYDMVPVDGTASFESARAMLRAVMCRAGVEQMMRDADVATAQEPAWSPWRDTALILSAEAHLLAGDVDRAAVLFGESSTVGVELGNTDSVVYAESAARAAGDGSAAAGTRPRIASHEPSRSSMSTGCTTTRPACSRSPPPLGSPCTTAMSTSWTDS